MFKRLVLASPLLLVSLAAFAQAPPKGLTMKLADPSTDVECTYWRIDSEQRNYRAGNTMVTLAGYVTAAGRDANKSPACSRTFFVGDFGAKKLDGLTLVDLYALVKEQKPGLAVAPLAPGAAPAPPPFKDAKIE